MDELRVSDGLRYNADYRMPTGEFTVDSNPHLLSHLDEGHGSEACDEANGEIGQLSGPTWQVDELEMTNSSVDW